MLLDAVIVVNGGINVLERLLVNKMNRKIKLSTSLEPFALVLVVVRVAVRRRRRGFRFIHVV